MLASPVYFGSLVVVVLFISVHVHSLLPYPLRVSIGARKHRSPLLCLAQKHKVVIQQGSLEHTLNIGEEESILEAGLDAGLDLPHDCKLGVCLTCPGKIVSGTVDQSGTTLDDSVVEQGYALMCMSYPRSDMVIRCIEEDELVGAQFSGRS